MFSYKCYAWIIAEANWTPFIWKNNGKSGSFYPPSWQFPISQRGPWTGCVVLLCKQALLFTASVGWLSCCSAGSPKPGARGCGQRICPGQREGKLLCRAICKKSGGQNCQVLGLRSWRGARKIVTLFSWEGILNRWKNSVLFVDLYVIITIIL